MRKVLRWMAPSGSSNICAVDAIRPDYCVIGEPSSSHQVGDVIRIGRRGSLNATLRVHGVQGHVAYPENTRESHSSGCTGTGDLASIELGSAVPTDFPPTTLQITNIHAGTGATNVVPGASRCSSICASPPRRRARVFSGGSRNCSSGGSRLRTGSGHFPEHPFSPPGSTAGSRRCRH